MWQQKLKHLVEVEQLGLRETARRLQVDPRTINRYVQFLGLKPKWRPQIETPGSDSTELLCNQSIDCDEIRTQHRDAWSKLQTQHLQASKTALRRFAPATYTWLYRHDRKWLHQNSPAAQTPVSSKNRVNWQERDEEVLTQVQEAVRRLLAIQKPIRITVSRVAKAIGQLALIEQHLEQMSQTRVYLDAVTESIEDLQIRRIKWAAELLDRQGESVDRWKIVRMAGLRPHYSEKVGRAIELNVYRRCEVRRNEPAEL